MPKLKELTYPSRIEARYTRQLLEYVKDLKKAAEPVLLRDPSLRQDAVADEIASLIEALKARFRSVWSDSRIRSIAQDMFQRVNAQNARAFNNQWGSVLPVQAIGAPWEEGASARFVRENVALIKSIDARYFDEIERIMLDATDKGLRSSEVAKQLRERFSVSQSRARLIARDQTGKLVGRLTVKRQQAAGVNKAEWSTSLDERVRKSHRRAEGKVFDLDKGLLVDGVRVVPGEPVNCRCASVPLIPEFD